MRTLKIAIIAACAVGLAACDDNERIGTDPVLEGSEDVPGQYPVIEPVEPDFPEQSGGPEPLELEEATPGSKEPDK